MSITAIIVIHNPDEDRFRIVLGSATSQANNVVVVNNVSVNRVH
ncbi:MAG: hypothetical protein ACP5NQ_07195 [Vulcanisaeta sp.]